MDAKLPFVFPERLPSGTVRYRFRRNGKKHALPGKPGDKEFHKAYSELLDGIRHTVETAEAAITQGSIAWLVSKYLGHMDEAVAAKLKSPLTLKSHRHHLGKLVAKRGRKDANMPSEAFLELRDAMMATPGSADNFTKAVSALYKWAKPRKHVTCDNPTRGAGKVNIGSDGFEPWDAADFTAFIKTHPPGTMAYRTLLLAISTTARRGDIVKLGRQHEYMKDGRKWLKWRQSKKPYRIVDLPMSEALLREVDGHTDMTYILTEKGRPFTWAGFGGRFRKWCDEAGIRKSIHGVRKGVSSLLPDSGATSYELDVLLGHEMNSEETKVYVRGAERNVLAESVIKKIDAVFG